MDKVDVVPDYIHGYLEFGFLKWEVYDVMRSELAMIRELAWSISAGI